MDAIATTPSTVEAETGTDIGRATAADRTKVILLGQIVVIVALLVVWSIVRGRQAAARATTT